VWVLDPGFVPEDNAVAGQVRERRRGEIELDSAYDLRGWAARPSSRATTNVIGTCQRSRPGRRCA
jgi:hypothetical protein